MDIWSLGGLNYLTAILSGIAKLHSIGVFEGIVTVGLTAAVLAITYQTIFKAREISWSLVVKIVLALLVFKMLFGPAVAVQVHDTYTLQSQTVNNVPCGVAFIGSVVSRVNHEVIKGLDGLLSRMFKSATVTEKDGWFVKYGLPAIAITEGLCYVAMIIVVMAKAFMPGNLSFVSAYMTILFWVMFWVMAGVPIITAVGLRL